MKKTLFFLFMCLSVTLGTISLSSFKEEKVAVAPITPPSLVLTFFRESTAFQALVLRQAQYRATDICNTSLQSYLQEIITPGTNVGAYKRYVYGESLRNSRVGDPVFIRLISAVLSGTYFENALSSGGSDQAIIQAIEAAIIAEYDNLAEVPQ
jgi:hypothetical protein